MLIEGVLGDLEVGDLHPVRVMAVINLGRESFYKASVAGLDEVLTLAESFVNQGAEVIDLGAVSTAPGSPWIDEAQEMERIIPALGQIADNIDAEVSVDTMRPGVAEAALSRGASCINDVSGFRDPGIARAVADHGASGIIMASRDRPGDLLSLDEIIPLLSERMQSAVAAGVEERKIVLDPGIGKWVPEKAPERDLAILDGLRRLRVLNRPVMAALSRKSFIGSVLGQSDPAERLWGSLAAAAIAVYNGAHIIRTHDVASTLDVSLMAAAVRGRPAAAPSLEEGIYVEVLGQIGQGFDLFEVLRRMEVDCGGWEILSKKGSFRQVLVSGVSSMEALIIKQEMLALGGDAAIPKLALRCDPRPEEVLVMGTTAQISGLVRKLQSQPFRLPGVGRAIEEALMEIDDPGRYR